MIAHLSDLHLGKASERSAWALREAIDDVPHTVVSGDITHRGLKKELALFHRIFGDLIAAGRLTAVPGNHDRLGDDVGDEIMAGPRVQTVQLRGAELVCIDSTSENNHSLLMPHGVLNDFDLAAVERALQSPAPYRVLVLHHHLVRLPEDSWLEWIGTKLRITQERECANASRLLDTIAGRVQIVLHGHRHRPGHVRARGIEMYNAGSSTRLQRFCVHSPPAHQGSGPANTASFSRTSFALPVSQSVASAS